nr:MAG: replication initiation protein [Microvirus sp.]
MPYNKPITIGETPMTVPCGRCIGCRIAHSQMWALRCTHEIQEHAQNCFLTLTYSPENIPKHGTLVKKHLQDFIKRYRKKFVNSHKIRFYACGEYGEKLSRPHYHILVFGHQFTDTVKLTSVLNTSEELSKLWKHGFHSIGEANFQTAAYIARYVTKKINGSQADKHYQAPCLETGELMPILGEFSTQSLKPGIGANWYEKYQSDVYPSDEIIHEGRRYPVPAYYDKLLERTNPELFEKVKQNRTDNFEELKLQNPNEYNTKRLLEKEKCKQAKITLHLKREYEKTL